MKNARHSFPGVILAAAMTYGGCSGGPVTPSPTPDPGPFVHNTPPTIGTFRVQGPRTNEPANFADVSEEVDVTVTVTDLESASSDLKFKWSADVGTFSGTGSHVTWNAPAVAATPIEVTINLEVVETYTSQGRSVENNVTGSTTLSLHDSIKEVSELAREFLLDFSDSRLDVDYVMRNFQPGCHGTAAETRDVTLNRERFNIIQSHVGPASTTINFGGFCSFRNKAGDGCARVPVYWRSRAKKDLYDQFTGQLALRAGEEEDTTGVDQLAAMYDPAQKRWRLCDSSFDSRSTSLKALRIRGLVP